MSTPAILANTDQVEYDLDYLYVDGSKTVDADGASATSSDETILLASIDAGKLLVQSVDGAIGTATVTVTDGEVSFEQVFSVVAPVPESGEVDLSSAVITKKTAAVTAPAPAAAGSATGGTAAPSA